MHVLDFYDSLLMGVQTFPDFILHASLLKDLASPRDFRPLPNTSSHNDHNSQSKCLAAQHKSEVLKPNWSHQVSPDLITSWDLAKSWCKMDRRRQLACSSWSNAQFPCCDAVATWKANTVNTWSVPWLQRITGHVGKDGSAMTSTLRFTNFTRPTSSHIQ